MSFLRGAHAEVDVGYRFRTETDGFSLWREGGWHVARTDAPAERSVALFHALSAEMPGTVSVALHRARDGSEWRGSSVALSDVRESIARLRPAVGRTGGLELTVWSGNLQLALSAQLSVWAWARDTAWRVPLEAAGLREVPREALADRRWASSRDRLTGSDELDEVTASVVERLGLTAASGIRRE